MDISGSRVVSSLSLFTCLWEESETLVILTHIFRELDIVSTQAEDQVRCVAQVDAVFNGLEKEWKSLQVKINSSFKYTNSGALPGALEHHW